MQFVSFFGMPLPAIPKGQTGLWLALVGLLFSSMLCAQRVNVIDQKGTKSSTGVEYTESATAPSSNLEGDLWLDISSSQSVLKVYSISPAGTASWIPLSSDPALDDLSDVTITNAANNEVLSYDASSSTWVNKALKDLKSIVITDNTFATPQNNPYTISTNPTAQRNFNINEIDIIIFNSSSGNNYLRLDPLDNTYNGKIIRVAERENQNPKISANSQDFFTTTTNELFDINFSNTAGITWTSNSSGVVSISPDPISEDIQINYEYIEFIWNNGEWIPMR